MKKILFFLAMSAIVLGMASCADKNSPTAGKPYKITVHDITPFGASIQITPQDKKALYFWVFDEAKRVDAYSSIEEYVYHNKSHYNIVPKNLDQGTVDYVIPSKESGCENPRDPNTEYAVIVFSIDEDNEPVLESIVAERFKTLNAVNRAFSVSDDEQVFFSPGNLYYDAAVKQYFFAENQWGYIGEFADYTSTKGRYDLFGWGTGNKPTQFSTNDKYYTSFSDWGDYPIVNGGNAKNLWRTLSMDEWYYIGKERYRADELIGLGTVHDVKGLIILPDRWKQISGVKAFKPAEAEGMDWKNGEYKDENLSNDHFTDNVFSDQEWEKMEESGALFLPAVGFRYDTGVGAPGTYGNYWCNNENLPNDPTYARDLYFQQHRIGLFGGMSRFYGASVRLVWKY